MKLGTYVIGQGDTIESLARVLLGDAGLTNTLIQLNALRYPYISDDPIDQYAKLKGMMLLTGANVDPSSLSISNINSINIMENDTVVLVEGSNFGSAIVSSFDGSIVTLASTINGSYDSGALAYVFSNQQNVTTRVLKTGDALLYQNDPSQSLSVGSDYSLLLGTDFKLDANGFLVRSANNDIDTVSGIDNLCQALKMRFQTALGTLSLHDTYGNALFNDLGEASSPYFVGLAKYHMQQCVKQESRIQTADITSVTIDEDQLIITLFAIPIGAQDPIVRTLNINIGGAG